MARIQPLLGRSPDLGPVSTDVLDIVPTRTRLLRPLMLHRNCRFKRSISITQ